MDPLTGEIGRPAQLPDATLTFEKVVVKTPHTVKVWPMAKNYLQGDWGEDCAAVADVAVDH